MAIQKPGKHSGDIAVDDGGGLVEGKATDSSGGVAPDPGEGFKGLSVGGKLSFKVVEEGLSRFL